MTLPDHIKQSLADKGYDVVHADQVSGGDINQARRLTTSTGQRYFLKYNTSPQGAGLLTSELRGIQLLEKSNHPTVFSRAYDFDIDTPYLLLDWIDSSKRSDEKLAIALHELHRTSGHAYGLDYTSHIGSLEKPGGWRQSFSIFYTELRISPLLRMVFDQGYRVRVGLEDFERLITSEFPVESPSLIHGDLWSGNLMDGDQGPIFIDPSVEYAHREMDLAMMRLFGGFSSDVLALYNDRFPLEKGWEERADLLQLFYLLVHLHLFGGSYFDSVDRIVKKYLD